MFLKLIEFENITDINALNENKALRSLELDNLTDLKEQPFQIF